MEESTGTVTNQRKYDMMVPNIGTSTESVTETVACLQASI
jgi:hypothetical protein